MLLYKCTNILMKAKYTYMAIQHTGKIGHVLKVVAFYFMFQITIVLH